MRQSTTSTIKREQRKSLLFRELSSLIHSVATDNPQIPELLSTYVTRVDFSADGGICYVYFWNSAGEELFIKARSTLLLYKPSIRSALAKTMQKKYTPDLVFLFDAVHAKEIRVNELLDRVQDEQQGLEQ